MKLQEIDQMIKESEFATLGFLDEDGNPSIRRVFCTWHKGLGGHLISTNTSSLHTQALMKNHRACLYFDDSKSFQGVCLTGTAVLHFDHEYRALLWHEQDVMYYPKGVDDEDYCVLEFRAERGRYYKYGDIGNISADELQSYDEKTEFTSSAKS